LNSKTEWVAKDLRIKEAARIRGQRRALPSKETLQLRKSQLRRRLPPLRVLLMPVLMPVAMPVVMLVASELHISLAAKVKSARLP
jgi:hypothetical protein